MARQPNTQTRQAAPPPRGNVPATRQQGGSVTDSAPDFMKNTGGQGTEAISSRDVEIPRLMLLQATSPAVMENDDLRPGQFYHSIAEEALTRKGDKLRVVPVYVDTRAMLWRPKDTGGGILARTDDMKTWQPSNASFDVKLKKGDKESVTWETKGSVDESRLLEWGSSDPKDPASAPAATRMNNLVLIFPDLDPKFSPAVLTLQRSALKVGRKFLGKMKIADVAMFGHVFELDAVQEEGPSGPYFVPRFTGVGFVQDKNEWDRYKAIYENFKREGLRIRGEDSLQDDETSTGRGGGDDPDDKSY